MLLALVIGTLPQIPADAVQLESGSVRSVVEQIAQRPTTFSMDGREDRPVAVVAGELPPEQILQHIADATYTTLTNTDQSLSLRQTAEDSAAILEDWQQNAINSLNAHTKKRPAGGDFMDQVDVVKRLLDRYIRSDLRERFQMLPEIRERSLEELLMLKILEQNAPKISEDLKSLDLRQPLRPNYAIRILNDPTATSQWDANLLEHYNHARIALRSVSNTFISSYGQAEFMEVGLPTSSAPAHEIWFLWKPGIGSITVNLYVFSEQGELLGMTSEAITFLTHHYERPNWLDDLEPVESPLAASLALADPLVLEFSSARFTTPDRAPNQEWLKEFLASGDDFLGALDPLVSEIARITGKAVIAAWPDNAYSLAMFNFSDGKISSLEAMDMMLAHGTIKITESDQAVVVSSQHPLFHWLLDAPRNVQRALYRSSNASNRLDVMQMASAISMERTAESYLVAHFQHYLRLLNASGVEGPDQNSLTVASLMLLGNLQIPANWKEAVPMRWVSTQWNTTVRWYVLNWLNSSMFIYPTGSALTSEMHRDNFTPYLLKDGIPEGLTIELDLKSETYWKRVDSTSNVAGASLNSLALSLVSSIQASPGIGVQEAASRLGPITFNDYPTLELSLTFPNGIGLHRTAVLIEGAEERPYLDYANWSPEFKLDLEKRIEEVRRSMQIDPSG